MRRFFAINKKNALCGVICEYNPFHRGHEYQLCELEKRGFDAVCIMSGAFIQRGGIPIFDKYARARAAVGCGAKLVYELPFPYCSLGARDFAHKGVFAAASLGLDALAFGCEDPEKLMLAVSAMSENGANRRIARMIDEDNALSYPRARQKYLAEMIKDTDFIARPNNILALEYMLAPHEGLTMLPLRRNPSYSSAAELRTTKRGEMLASLPPAALRAFENEPEYSISRLTEAIIAFLRSKKPQELDGIYDMTFDLAYRLTAAASSARTLPELLDKLRARTFTDSKLRRLILNAYFGVTRENALADLSYTVLLAAASGATPLAGEIASRARIPIVTNPGSYRSILSGKASEAFERALRAESVVSLCCEGDAPPLLSRSPYIG